MKFYLSPSGRSSERPFFVSGLVRWRRRMFVSSSRRLGGDNSIQVYPWGCSTVSRLWHRFHRFRERRTQRHDKTIML